MVISAASEFLLKWLLEYEHEQRQWSAAISLGLVSTCFDATDWKQRFEVVNGLLKVHSNATLHHDNVQQIYILILANLGSGERQNSNFLVLTLLHILLLLFAGIL